jgi:hypothetical protein
VDLPDGHDATCMMQLSTSVYRSSNALASDEDHSNRIVKSILTDSSSIDESNQAVQVPNVVWVDSLEETTDWGHRQAMSETERVDDNSMMKPGRTASVPKLIHFMYKEDLSQSGLQWPNPIWNVSFQAWKTYFPESEYRYLFWTDESIDEVFKAKCPEHYRRFSKFTFEIYRADLGRYCILKSMGGIYSDLDYEPRSNFYNDLLPGSISLIESPYANEDFQNSLMASPKGSMFSEYWMGILDTFANNVSESLQQSKNPDEITGPHIVDIFMQSPKNYASELVNKLPCKDFQRKVHRDGEMVKQECGYLTTTDSVKGIHWGTVSWVQDGQLRTELVGEVSDADTVNLFRSIHPDIII